MNPSCDVVRTFLPAYLDDEASPLSRTVLERHLDTCAACTRRAEGLERLRETVRRAWVPTPVPEALRRRVEALCSDRRPRPREALVAGLAGLAVGLTVWRGPWLRWRRPRSPGRR